MKKIYYYFIFFLLLRYMKSRIVKPSFIPYCATRDSCKTACSCKIISNCSLLDMEESDRISILSYVNQIRDIQSVAEPQSEGMVMLTYDMQLEEVSKCWAARCELKYSDCFVTSNYSETSQAITQIQSQNGQPDSIMWLEVIKSWLHSGNYLFADSISRFPGGKLGDTLHNYGQIMSDNIFSIGCAWSARNETVLFVCTFGPRGPRQGEPIYKIGPRCSLCPKYYSCNDEKPFENLCKELDYTQPSQVGNDNTPQLAHYIPGERDISKIENTDVTPPQRSKYQIMSHVPLPPRPNRLTSPVPPPLPRWQPEKYYGTKGYLINERMEATVPHTSPDITLDLKIAKNVEDIYSDERLGSKNLLNKPAKGEKSSSTIITSSLNFLVCNLVEFMLHMLYRF